MLTRREPSQAVTGRHEKVVEEMGDAPYVQLGLNGQEQQEEARQKRMNVDGEGYYRDLLF